MAYRKNKEPQTTIKQILFYLAPSIGLTALLSIFVTFKFDNDETSPLTFGKIAENEYEERLFKFGVILSGVFILIKLLAMR